MPVVMAIQTTQQPAGHAPKTVPISEDLHLLLKLRAARERVTIRELAERILRPAVNEAAND